MSLLCHWVKHFGVELARPKEKRRVFVHVCGPRLVEDIVADDIGVLLESLGNFCPEGEHLVQESILVRVQS